MENNKVILKLIPSLEEIDINYIPAVRIIESNSKILQVCYCSFDKSITDILEPNMNIIEIYKYFSQMMKPVFKQLSETCGYTLTELTEVDINPILTKFINHQINKI